MRVPPAFLPIQKGMGILYRQANENSKETYHDVGKLGPDEQAMILCTSEEKRFLPVGVDKPVASAFQVIAGTNRDLGCRGCRGAFREDMFTRANLWSFTPPGLAAGL